jgi:hypothetical protein
MSVLLAKYYSADRITKNEIGGGMWHVRGGGKTGAVMVLVGKTEGDNLEDLGVDGRKISKWISEK